MYFSKKSFFSTLLIAAFIFLAAPLKGNPGDFSDDELKYFANAVVQVISIQQQGQMQMIEQIEEHDMTVQRFNELYMQAQQMPMEDLDLEGDEMDSFVEIVDEIEKIQMELESVLVSTIEGEGLTLEKYESIMTEYQQNPELQQKIQQLME